MKEGSGIRTRSDGIRTVDDLRRRCRVDEDCWHWHGAVDKKGTPKTWFPPFLITSTIGPVIAYLRTGIRPKKAVWLRSCSSPDCVNPEHWSKASHSIATRRHPRRNPVLHTINVAMGRRASSKLSEADVAGIRDSTDLADDCAARHGISRSSVYRIRRGQSWKPLVMPTNSVFAWAQAITDPPKHVDDSPPERASVVPPLNTGPWRAPTHAPPGQRQAEVPDEHPCQLASQTP